MTRVVDYQQVLAQAAGQGLRCLYPSGGAFGFGPEVATRSIGWIGPADESIRPGARALVRQVAPPFAAELARLALAAWQRVAPGPVWLLPKSHWAYELQFGSAEWLPQLLQSAAVNPADLLPVHQAAAVALDVEQTAVFLAVLETMLLRLSGSDFTLLFPGYPLLCTVHSHQQLWWTTSDEAMYGALDQILPAC